MNTRFKITFKINDKLKDEVVFDKQSSEESNTELIVENDLSTIISKLNTLIIECKNKQEIYEFNYTVSLIDSHNNVKKLFDDEKALFYEARKYDTLSAVIITYLKATDHGKYNSRIWEDCETPLGNDAILALVTKDKKWMPQYISFLRTCDLDHEVNQGHDMEQLIEQYNWCEETCAMAIARLLTCHGQHGSEQFEEFLEAEFSNYITENKTLFIKKLIEEFQYASNHDNSYSNYLKIPKEKYLNQLFEEIEIITALLNENDLEIIKTKLSDLWNTFNTKE